MFYDPIKDNQLNRDPDVTDTICSLHDMLSQQNVINYNKSKYDGSIKILIQDCISTDELDTWHFIFKVAENVFLSPVICGDFTIHKSIWPYTSSTGTASMDFCDSPGLHI